MILRIIILSTLLFSAQLVQANFLSDLSKEWVKNRKESSRKSCLKRYSTADVKKIDSVLTNKDPKKSGILITKGENPAGWFTVSDKVGLKILCHDSRLSRYVQQNRLEPVGLNVNFFCGYQVYACNMQPQGGDRDSLGVSEEGPTDGDNPTPGDDDNGGSDTGGGDDSDDGGSTDDGDDGGDTDGSDDASDDGGTDDGLGDDDGGINPDDF